VRCCRQCHLLVDSWFSAADDARAAIRMPTNIPAQGLGQRSSVCAGADLQVLYFSQTYGICAQPAIGELTADETLTQLLSGTGLTYRLSMTRQ